MSMGNSEKAREALLALDGGESLSSVLARHTVSVEIEVHPGVVVSGTPFIGEDGRAHLVGKLKNPTYGEMDYHFSADPENVEKAMRDAVENNLPLRLLSWYKQTFKRSPILLRAVASPFDGPTPGPSRLLKR